MANACSIDCAIAMATKKRQDTQAKEDRSKRKAEREERKKTREALRAMETRPQLVKRAQDAFNAFVRARDAGKPCISCGRPLAAGGVGGGYDCGHYRSVGSAPHMRFVEDNAHGQCKHCNQYLAGNHVEYRKRLIERIGLERVEQIESDQTTRKITREGLIEMAAHYRAEARRLEATPRTLPANSKQGA